MAAPPDDHGSMKGGVDEFIAGARTFLPKFVATMHFMGNMLIDLDGDVARAETYAVAYHREQLADGSGRDDIWGIRYVDRFERRWFFVSFCEQFYWRFQFVEFFVGEWRVVVGVIEFQQFKHSFVYPILVGGIVFAVILRLFVGWIFIGEFCSVAIEWFCIEFWSFRQFRKP